MAIQLVATSYGHVQNQPIPSTQAGDLVIAVYTSSSSSRPASFSHPGWELSHVSASSGARVRLYITYRVLLNANDSAPPPATGWGYPDLYIFRGASGIGPVVNELRGSDGYLYTPVLAVSVTDGTSMGIVVGGYRSSQILLSPPAPYVAMPGHGVNSLAGGMAARVITGAPVASNQPSVNLGFITSFTAYCVVSIEIIAAATGGDDTVNGKKVLLGGEWVQKPLAIGKLKVLKSGNWVEINH